MSVSMGGGKIVAAARDAQREHAVDALGMTAEYICSVHRCRYFMFFIQVVYSTRYTKMKRKRQTYPMLFNRRDFSTVDTTIVCACVYYVSRVYTIVKDRAN